MREQRIHGRCKCGRAVIKALYSEVETFRRDGTRYAYPETIDRDRWSVFRCESCREPIHETFIAAPTLEEPSA